MTDRELLQQALDAIEAALSDDQPYISRSKETVEALRSRLAQPEPEPFEYWNAVEGWVKIEEVRQHFDTAGCGTIYKTSGEGRVPLYTAPQREWQGLNPKEISEIAFLCRSENPSFFAHAVEAKLKEKNYD